jgi:hypothetical protein
MRLIISNVLFLAKHKKTDMIFAFGSDGAHSIFNVEKKLAKEIIDSQSDKDVKYSVIKYGSTARIELPFRDATSITRLKQVIDVMHWETPGLAVDDVVRKAVENFEQNGRPKAQRVLVLFVSGRASSDERQSTQLKKSLAEAGVNTVVIALNINDEGKIKRIIPGEKPIITTDPNKDTKETVTDVITGITQGNQH